MMMTTLRKAMALFLEHPRLWLPVIVAGLLDIGSGPLLSDYGRWLAGKISFASKRPSVLLAHPDPVRTLSYKTVWLLYIGGAQVVLFFEALLCACALYATVKIVRHTLRGNTSQAVAESPSPWPIAAILRLAGWLFGIWACVEAVPVVLASFEAGLFGNGWMPGLLRVASVPAFLVGAWLCGPFMVRFAAAQSDGIADAATVRAGRKLVCLIACVSYVFSLATYWLVEGVYYLATNVPVDDSLVQAIVRLVMLAAPVIVLFIALALLTTTEGDEPLHEAAEDAPSYESL